jgi:antitoxin component YwqK of YwqJK toxin-antitoxin module
MRQIVVLIVFLLFFTNTFGQAIPDSGFTNKYEAQNGYKMVGKHKAKDGKWIEYTSNTNDNFTTDTNALFYRLTTYKNGRPVGLQRGYYRSGKLYYFMYRVPTPDSIPWPDIQRQWYEDGKLMAENIYFNKHGKLRERHFEYYENGKIKLEMLWTRKGWGEIKEYDENGKEIKK